MLKSRLESLLLTAVAFLTPLTGVLATTLILIVLDLITGLLAARKEGSPVTSFGLKRTVMKLLVYELALVLAYITGLYLTGPEIPVLQLASSLIGLTELKSIYENLSIISGDKLLSTLVTTLQRTSSNNKGEDSESK